MPIPVWVTSSDGHGEISIHFQKICEIVIALLKRNLISAWGVMWNSDFHITPPCRNLISTWAKFHLLWFDKFLEVFIQIFVRKHLYIQNLSNDSLKITKKNRKIPWLTLTGIQFPNGPWLSGMKISSSLGLKKFPYLKTGPFRNPIFL